MTIAEIIAAKKAGTTGAPATPTPTTTARKETLTERIEADALDARLAPVKPSVATAARKAAGIVLSMDLPADSPNGERRGQATPIKGPEDTPPRCLGASEGETIDVTPLAADPAIKDWHKAVNAFSTEMVIMHDPIDPTRAWLAVRLDEDPLHPLLIKDLPIYEHPRAHRKPNEPF